MIMTIIKLILACTHVNVHIIPPRYSNYCVQYLTFKFPLNKHNLTLMITMTIIKLILPLILVIMIIITFLNICICMDLK